MFRQKCEPRDRIQVIKTRNETREIIEEENQYFDYRGGRAEKKKTTKKVNVTIVLAVINGELVTREFNGKWDMEDVKKWEDL